MDPMSILFPVLSVGGMGVVFGACLGVASEVFKVEEDPRIGQVLECLPGANCGGCGFPGCGGCASAIVAGMSSHRSQQVTQPGQSGRVIVKPPSSVSSTIFTG